MYTTAGDFCADLCSAFRRPAEYLVARAAAVASGSGSVSGGPLLSPTGGSIAEFKSMALAGFALRNEWSVLWSETALELWDELAVARLKCSGREESARARLAEQEEAQRLASSPVVAEPSVDEATRLWLRRPVQAPPTLSSSEYECDTTEDQEEAQQISSRAPSFKPFILYYST